MSQVWDLVLISYFCGVVAETSVSYNGDIGRMPDMYWVLLDAETNPSCAFAFLSCREEGLNDECVSSFSCQISRNNWTILSCLQPDAQHLKRACKSQISSIINV